MKKAVSPDRKRKLVTWMCKRHGVSIRQGYKAVSLPRSTYRYRCKPKYAQLIIDELLVLLDKHPAIGFWHCDHRLRAMGHRWNHKRLYRAYIGLKLNFQRRTKPRLPARAKQQLFQPDGPNQVWSLDYPATAFGTGARFAW